MHWVSQCSPALKWCLPSIYVPSITLSNWLLTFTRPTTYTDTGTVAALFSEHMLALLTRSSCSGHEPRATEMLHRSQTKPYNALTHTYFAIYMWAGQWTLYLQNMTFQLSVSVFCFSFPLQLSISGFRFLHFKDVMKHFILINVVNQFSESSVVTQPISQCGHPPVW